MWLLTAIVLTGISSRAMASGAIVTDAPDPHLTVDQAISFAIHHHPRLFAYRHRVAAKKAKIGEANAHFLPNVGAGAMFGTGNPGVSNRPYNNGYAYSPFMPITYGGIGPLGRDGTQTSNVFDASIGATQMLFDFGRYLHLTRSAEKKDAIKFGRWIGKGVPAKLKFYRESGNSLVFPRGYSSEVIMPFCRLAF